jgi:hypothetical protein
VTLRSRAKLAGERAGNFKEWRTFFFANFGTQAVFCLCVTFSEDMRRILAGFSELPIYL